MATSGFGFVKTKLILVSFCRMPISYFNRNQLSTVANVTYSGLGSNDGNLGDITASQVRVENSSDKRNDYHRVKRQVGLR